MAIFFFFLGAIFGSFLNVLAVRYKPEQWLGQLQTINGRSRCPQCGKELSWYELVPLVSYIIQGGRCRSCQARISFRYPLVELTSGFVFLSVFAAFSFEVTALSVLWVAVFSLLLTVSLIDLEWQIIPDEAVAVLAVLGIAISFLSSSSFGLVEGSSIGHYSLLFGFRDSLLLNRIVAAAVGFLIFIFLILITRGRGMGGGDLKLAVALGLIFGWPDIVFITAFAFILGSFVAVPLLYLKKRGRKDVVPFGPFLAAAAFLVFLCGEEILSFYFSLFRL